MLSFAPLIALPLAASPAIYLSGRSLTRYARLSQRLSLLALALCWGLWVVTARDVAVEGTLTMRAGMVWLRVDGLSLLMIFLALLFGTLVVLFSGPDMRGAVDNEKYYTILLISIGAMIGLVCAADLFNLWLWFEMMAITSYLLVGFYCDQRRALAASIKYLVQTATGSALVLFAVALILSQSGTLELAAIHLPASPLAVVAGTLFCIGFGVKIAIVPTYTWLPDAYAYAPSGVSALLSGVVTITGLAALLRVLSALWVLSPDWGALLIGFGLLNIMVGNALALSQREVKRLLAYSSISHTGFILLAVGIALYSGQAAGLQAGLLHLVTHGLGKVLAFLAVGALIYVLHLDSRATLDDLAGTAHRYPMLALALVLAILSLVGIPPLAGFMSKWQIFAAGLTKGGTLMDLVVIFAALNSVFTLSYYLPLINALFRSDDRPADLRVPLAMQGPVLGLAVALLVVGLFPQILNGLIQPAVLAILGP